MLSKYLECCSRMKNIGELDENQLIYTLHQSKYINIYDLEYNISIAL
jgi:hypothetical protein